MKKTTEKKKTKAEELPTIEDLEDLSNEQMVDLLIELSGTSYWHAIKKFVRNMDSHIINSLISIDPFKNPTEMARSQGMRNGLYSLENWAVIENKKRKDAAEGKNENS